MDTLRAMAVFVRVIDTGSFTAAAATCGMSSTMVGKYLQTLEDHLGAKLLIRTTRRQNLTEFGKTYYDRCVEILSLVSDAEALAQNALLTPRGRLRVTAPVTFGTERLMPAIGDYLARYPTVQLEVALSDVVIDLVKGEFEAAIRLGALPDSGLIARALAPYHMMIAAAPGYLERKGTPRRPEDLAEHECLAYSYPMQSEWREARFDWQMTGPDGPKAIRVSGHLQVDNAPALRRAALRGIGVVMLPVLLLENDVAEGRLVRLLPDCELPSRPMHIVYLPDRRMSPKLRSFIEFVIERFGPR